MLGHGRTLHVTEEMAQLLWFFNMYPPQPMPHLMPVYEHTKFQERYFRIKFFYEKIISILYITKGGTLCSLPMLQVDTVSFGLFHGSL